MPHPAAKNLTSSFFLRRRFWQCLTVLSLVIACAVAAGAQTRVPGNSGRHWVDTGIDVDNGTQIQVSATGTVNVGAPGIFGPEGTTAFRSELSFPAGGPVYGLVIRLTSSRTNSQDELREDYFYATDRNICFRAPGHIWLTVNDNQPEDNTGAFIVTLTRGTCGRTDTTVRETRIHVADQGDVSQSGADVYVNGRRVGVTDDAGLVRLLPLANGDQIIARKQIFESSTYRNNHRQGGTQNWNYRVYLTTMTVNNDGTLSPFVVSNPAINQELRLNRSNTLIGVHILAALEWDASQTELNLFRSQLGQMSQFLYDATDGQFFVERADLVDDAAYWDDADIRIFADLDVRPNVNLRRGGFRHGGLGTWMNLRRPPGTTTDSWSYFGTFAHEFGHYGFDLGDEYADNDNTVFCTMNHNSMTSEYRGGQPKSSCMMFYQFDAGKLCSNRAENPHRRGTRQGDESCWSHLVSEYRDTMSFPRWNIQTPDTRGAIVGGLPNMPEAWTPVVNVENRTRGYDPHPLARRTTLCQPFTVTVANRDTGAPMDGQGVWLHTSYGQNILEGTTGGYESGGGRVSFGEGMIPITGVHVGDRITAAGGEYVVQASDCSESARLEMFRDDRVRFVPASATITDASTFFLPQKAHVQMSVSSEPFSMFVSVEPAGTGGQLNIHVRTDSPLKFAPQVEVTQTGSTTALKAPMTFDAATQSYSSTGLRLPVGAYGNVQVIATAESGQTAKRLFSLVLSPLNANSETDIFSANGQLNITVPNGALPATALVAVGPSSAPLPPLNDGDMIVSGPFGVSASSGKKMRQQGVIRFQLSNLRGARASDGFDPRSFEIRRFNPETQRWESLGATFLPSVDVISVFTNQLGDYAVTAHTLPGTAGGKKNEARKPDENKKPEQTKGPGEGEKPTANFMVSDAVLKADNPKVSGPCPVTVKFGGYITANGPGQVQYTFTRSDGATGPTFTVNFKAAGPQYINTTWMLGGQGLNSFEGWQAIKILAPNEFESSHEAGSFVMQCQGSEKPVEPLKTGEGEKQATNLMVTDAGLKADDAKVSGPCPVTIKFGGYITANGPGQVQYQFTRSDGATGPTVILDFKGAGTQYVITTWTLGGQGLNSFEGWQAIKILTPNEFESSHETGSFVMQCQGKT